MGYDTPQRDTEVYNHKNTVLPGSQMKAAPPFGSAAVSIEIQVLFGNPLEPFHHTEHNAHRDDADREEYSPSHPNRISIVDERTNPEQQIAYGRCTEPQTLAKALEMLGSNFRNERQTERRNEQLCHSQEEVEYEEHPRSCLESGRSAAGRSLNASAEDNR